MARPATHILVGTDFSAASGLAVERAGELAKHNHARVTLAHVFDPGVVTRSPSVRPGSSGPMALNEQLELEQTLREGLGALRDSKLGDVEEVELALLTGINAAVELCAYAKANNVDLIVLSAHGESGIDHLLIGSITERVVRHAHCPVFVMRDPASIDRP